MSFAHLGGDEDVEQIPQRLSKHARGHDQRVEGVQIGSRRAGAVVTFGARVELLHRAAPVLVGEICLDLDIQPRLVGQQLPPLLRFALLALSPLLVHFFLVRAVTFRHAQLQKHVQELFGVDFGVVWPPAEVTEQRAVLLRLGRERGR